MNFAELYLAREKFDEVMAIGTELEREGRFYHIVGMTRQGKAVRLYILEEPEEAPDKPENQHRSNRDNMLLAPNDGYFSYVTSIVIADVEMRASGLCTEWLGASEYCHSLFFYEMMKAGWELPDDSRFLPMDWSKICMTTINFNIDGEKLPEWENGRVIIKHGRRTRKHLVGRRLSLTVGQEAELEFTLEDSRRVKCYINKVMPIDVWKENEEKFSNPKYLELMTEAELEKHKREFFEALEQNCPRGMCYSGIEYECEPEGGAVFYDADFLDAGPKECSGSARIIMMNLRPDNPLGRHGLLQRGCIVQTPIKPDTREIAVELMYFMEMLPECEETV